MITFSHRCLLNNLFLIIYEYFRSYFKNSFSINSTRKHLDYNIKLCKLLQKLNVNFNVLLVKFKNTGSNI